MLTGSLHIFANSIFLCGTLEAINISEPSKYTHFQNNNNYTGRDAETNRNTANEIKEAGGEDEHGNDFVQLLCSQLSSDRSCLGFPVRREQERRGG